jgi:hypothetical protein
VQVGMTDTAIENADGDIARTRFAPGSSSPPRADRPRAC